MEEKNKHSLNKAIEALPVYTADAVIWEQIEGVLEIQKKDEQVQELVPQLATYRAPKIVWENISTGLEQNSPPVYRIDWWSKSRKRLGGIAVAITFLGVVGFLLNQSISEQSVQYVYDQEKLNPYLKAEDWENDEAVFAEVVAQFERYTQIFKDPVNEQLKAEFQSLEEDRNELKTAIELYGKDYTLIRQLANLERTRTEVIKQMASKI